MNAAAVAASRPTKRRREGGDDPSRSGRLSSSEVFTSPIERTAARGATTAEASRIPLGPTFAERLLRRGRDLLGIREADPRLSWERQVKVAERIPEYITVEAPALDPGEYVIRLRLTDLVNGNEAERGRRVRVLARDLRPP